MLQADPASTAFFYCARSTAEPARAKPVEILCALLRQLCSSKPDQSIDEPVVREYEARKKKADEDCSAIKRLTVEDCTKLIIELTKNHSATIILDALDESEEHKRHEILEAFENIISSSENVVKIFVSSRDDIDIVSTFYNIIVLSRHFTIGGRGDASSQAQSYVLTDTSSTENASRGSEKHFY